MVCFFQKWDFIHFHSIPIYRLEWPLWRNLLSLWVSISAVRQVQMNSGFMVDGMGARTICLTYRVVAAAAVSYEGSWGLSYFNCKMGALSRHSWGMGGSCYSLEVLELVLHEQTYCQKRVGKDMLRSWLFLAWILLQLGNLQISCQIL